MRSAKIGVAVGLFGAALLLPRASFADEVATCVKANEQAQSLRDEGKYKRAREQLLVCTRDVCPGIVRKDCMQWLSDLDASMPSVVINAKDAGGRDLVDVKVTVDGQPLTEKLDGKPIAIDPGEHAFHYEAAGAPPVDDKILLHAGEKNRVLAVKLGAAPATPPPPAPRPPPPRHEGTKPSGGGGVPAASDRARRGRRRRDRQLRLLRADRQKRRERPAKYAAPPTASSRRSTRRAASSSSRTSRSASAWSRSASRPGSTSRATARRPPRRPRARSRTSTSGRSPAAASRRSARASESRAIRAAAPFAPRGDVLANRRHEHPSARSRPRPRLRFAIHAAHRAPHPRAARLLRDPAVHASNSRSSAR